MIRLKLALAIITIILIGYNSAFAIYNVDQNRNAPERESDRIIVKFRQDASNSLKISKTGVLLSGPTEISRLNSRYKVKNLTPLMNRESDRISNQAFKGTFILNMPLEGNLEEVVAEYRRLPSVEYAEIDQIAQFFDTPNDILYPYQWNLNNTGQEHYHVKRNYGTYNDELILVSGMAGSDIKAGEVFQNPPDNTSTSVVAIIDTGVDMEHPDLIENIWINPGEIADDGFDNDHNGFIDDIHGWNFGGSLSNIGVGDNDPSDGYGHGTHVAGIVAATTGNEIGVVGAAENCRIMALCIDPIPFVSIIARSIIYAADNGADAINMSFGLYTRSDLVEDALAYAHSRGVILCAAAGNDGTEQYNYPAASDNVIAVGATNDKDIVTSFSTYGDHLNLCAPGLAILSLRASGTDMYASDREPGVHIIDNLYFIASGTSMSSPHVTGAGAYMRAISPGLKPEKVLEILEQTADDLNDPYGVGWDMPGFDIYSGYGRLNLYSALQAVPEIRAEITSPSRFEIVSGMVQIRGTADGDGFSSYTVEYGYGKEPGRWYTIIVSPSAVTDGVLANWNVSGLNGIYSIRLRVGDDNAAYTTVYIANEMVARIMGPADGSTSTGITEILANAYSPDFKNFMLEYGLPGQDVWEKIDSSAVPAYGDIVSDWSSGEFPEGDYVLRLTVINNDETTFSDEINIKVQALFSSDEAWKIKLDGQPTIIPNYGDFDGNGNSEIVVGTSSGIYIFNTDGTEKTEGIPDFPDNNFMIPIAVGELDGDGIDDIVALGYDPPMVYSYPSSAPDFVNYLANFPSLDFISTEHYFTKLFLKDIDNDGYDEIIVNIYNRNKPLAFIIESDGSSQKMFEYPSEFLPADLNGDGLDEIYAYYQDFSALRRIDMDGNTLDEITMDMDGQSFNCQGLSACDVDGDGGLELIGFGYYGDSEYWLHAFDENFVSVPSWPHDMGIDPFVLPTMPVFGDLDDDGNLEYISTFYDLDISYIMAWNMDGTSFLPGSPNGHFASTPQLGVANMPLIGDMNGDRKADIITCTNDDPFSTFTVQRIYVWDNNASLLTGYPLVVAPEASTSSRHAPSIGDINGDGFVDLIMTTADSFLVFVNMPGQVYRECATPAGHWRYNRRMNNIAPGVAPCDPTDMADSPNHIPDSFRLLQNYPNPFNASTAMRFNLPTAAFTELSIYNILGQNINRIFSQRLAAGSHTVIWDGKDADGNDVASGIYFYRLATPNFAESKKMILIK